MKLFFKCVHSFPRSWNSLLLLWLSLAVMHAVDAQPYGLNGRMPNTTLRMPPDPPSYSYTTVDAFPALQFVNPVDVVAEPGRNDRLYVIERVGRIIVITNLASPTRTVFLDISSKVKSDYPNAEGLTSIAFHPGYATNRLFYVTYSLSTSTSAGIGQHNRLSRFQRSATNPFQALATSDVPFITQRDEGIGHSMNDLLFGPDGYLYLSVGDEGDGGSGDDWNNAQRVDKDFFSAILRIDVDKKAGNLSPNPHPAISPNYLVPTDNPYVGITSFNGSPIDPTKVRTEFYAVGFRNPWRMFLDPPTGLLYVGDVGQHAREEINIVYKGGNYGWAYFEGTLTGSKGMAPPGFQKIDPIYQYGTGYGPFEGTTVIGGVVYRGDRIPELKGAYIFADYTSGNIWSLRTDGWTVSNFQRLTGDPGMASFALDPRNGDVLMVDTEEGRIKRLERAVVSGQPLPTTLADTGVFSDLAALTPQPGIIPYDLNVAFWSDNARKMRWFSVPDTNSTMTFSAEGNWGFPAGTVWVKHFDLQMTNGDAASARRIETRVLVKNAAGVYGVTYRWDAAGGNALLVPEDGLSETFQIKDGVGTRSQVWRYPSRNECLACHTAVGGHALGFNTAQMNRNFDYAAATDNQLRALSHAGYFSQPVSSPDLLRRLAPASDESVSREYRVRSYLAANCVQCHQPGGTAQGSWDARLGASLDAIGLINGSLSNPAGDSTNRVVVPGDAAHSMLLTRIANFTPLPHMPPLATSVLNTEAVNLMRDWIAQDLPGYESFAQWQTRLFGSSTAENARPDADPDGDGAVNRLEYLVGSNPTNSSDGWRIQIRRATNGVDIIYPQVANRGFEVQATTSAANPFYWTPLDIYENRPLFSATNGMRVVRDPVADSRKYYRVRVFEP